MISVFQAKQAYGDKLPHREGPSVYSLLDDVQGDTGSDLPGEVFPHIFEAHTPPDVVVNYKELADAEVEWVEDRAPFGTNRRTTNRPKDPSAPKKFVIDSTDILF